jgi:hypothetical protein
MPARRAPEAKGNIRDRELIGEGIDIHTRLVTAADRAASSRVAPGARAANAVFPASGEPSARLGLLCMTSRSCALGVRSRDVSRDRSPLGRACETGCKNHSGPEQRRSDSLRGTAQLLRTKVEHPISLRLIARSPMEPWSGWLVRPVPGHHANRRRASVSSGDPPPMVGTSGKSQERAPVRTVPQAATGVTE